MILIVGGTGDLGSATARRLLRKNKAVRIMTRRPEKAAELRRLGAEVVQGDLLDKSSLLQACRGAEQVLASAHSIFGRGREASKYVDLQGHKDLIDAAKEAGVRHFVYTSGYDFGAPYDRVPIFQFKRQVARYLQESKLSYTILRPTAFMEFHAEKMIGQPVLEKGKVTLFGRGEQPRNFVAADDVAHFAVLALEDARLQGQTIDIGGPANLTTMDVVRIYEQLAGRPAKVSHVPIAVLKVMYPVLRPLHPGLSQIMQASIYVDAVGEAFDSGPALAQYPFNLARLEEWASNRIATGLLAPLPAVA